MSRLWDILDFVFFTAIIVLSIYVYFEVSQAYGLYMVGGGIVFYVLSYAVKIPQVFPSLKFGKLMKVLVNYQIIREEKVQSLMEMSPDKIHQQFYKLAKVWKYQPMILFIGRYYIFINTEVIDGILAIIKKHQIDHKLNVREAVKEIGQTYDLPTRVEIDAIISRLRESGELN